MIALTTKRWSRENGLLIPLLLLGVFGGILGFNAAYFSNTNVLIGLCLFPFTFLITGPRRDTIPYVSLTVLFAALAMTYQVRIFYFFSLAFYFLWLFELMVGRLNVLILFLIVFMSPFFIQVVTILGFPLRLLLSKYAGGLLNVAGLNVQVEGNMMILEGSTFSVDEACMGLNMLVISLLMGVFVLAYRYRVSATTLKMLPTITFFVVAFILNMFTNVIRIIVLVLFRIPPEHMMHELIGILCLVVYVLVPLHFFSAWIVGKYGEAKNDSQAKTVLTLRSMTLIAVIPLIVLFTGATLEDTRVPKNATHANVSLGKIKPEESKDGITKFTTNDLLIYVKAIPEFFTGEHTPLMCWKGSGYEFSGVTTASVEGISIYKGTLIRNGKSLHTAWWYSNGQVETISQLDWRLRMLKGEPDFCLVNVTAQDDEKLMTAIKSMLTTERLTINTDI